MPLIIADRVRETTTTSGTGPISLAGPYAGFQAFSVIGNGNTTYYVIVDALNIAWEVGIGTYSSAGNTLARTTVLASSNAGSLVNFGAGTKDVILTQPAGRSVLVQQGGAGLLTGTAAFTANGIPYANSTNTLTTGSALTFDGTTFVNTAGGIAAAGTIDGAGFYSYAVGGEGGQLSLANPTNTGTVASFDVVNATTARLFTTINNAVLQIGQLAGTGGVVSLFTNTTERMRIDSAGNVGIGTSAPTQRLDLGHGNLILGTAIFTGAGVSTEDVALELGTLRSASGNVYIDLHATAGTDFSARFIRFAGANGALELSNVGTGDLRIRQGNLAPIVFDTGSTERMRIDASGNVGIGTSSISGGGGGTILNVSGATAASFRVSNSISGDALDAFITGGVGYLQTATAIPLVLRTNATERMRITSAGNVGIGTSSPNTPLEVNVASGNNEFRQSVGGVTRGQLISTTTDQYLVSLGSGAQQFWTSGSERMRIDSVGNVQVQTGAIVQWAPAPASISTTATLTNANIQGQIINTTGTSYTVTMPLGTTLETLVPWAATNLGYDFSVINTASGTITMAVNTGVTSLGGLTIATGVSARFRIRRTAANTFILYRLS